MKIKSQKGFGLVEVMISALVLGFMLIGLNRLQVSNRWQLAYNDAKMTAMGQAQRVLDSLQMVGVATLADTTTFNCSPQGMLADSIFTKRPFTCNVYTEALGFHKNSADDTTMVYSRRIKVQVQFDINQKTHNIEMNGVVE